MFIEMLVLANSSKNGGRCLAGINTLTGEWVRPVIERSGNQLHNEVTCIDGRFLRPGDVIGLEINEKVPQPHHPENFLFEPESIHLFSSEDIFSKMSSLEKCFSMKNELVEKNSDRISSQELKAKEGLANSLALVAANNIRFYTSSFGKPRVSFEVDGVFWNLANTDDKGHWHGKYDQGLVCISVGDYYDLKDAHFKLACGFIPLDESNMDWGEKLDMEVRMANSTDIHGVLDLIDFNIIERRKKSRLEDYLRDKDSQIFHRRESLLDEASIIDNLKIFKRNINNAINGVDNVGLKVAVAIRNAKVIGFCSWYEQPYWGSPSEFDLWLALHQMHTYHSKFESTIKLKLLIFLAGVADENSNVGIFGWSSPQDLWHPIFSNLGFSSVTVEEVMYERWIWYIMKSELKHFIDNELTNMSQLKRKFATKFMNLGKSDNENSHSRRLDVWEDG